MAQRLSQLLGQQVGMAVDCIGPEVERSVAALKAGDVLLLENLRFHAGEEAGDPDFAKALARLGDIYVNDAFGTSHRAHASIAGIPKYLPAVAGLLLEKEVDTLGGLLEDPARPFTAVFGGAKVSDKVALLKNIMGKVDRILIGGGMAATFLKTQAYNVGSSVVEAESEGVARELIEQAAASGARLRLPVDVVVADELRARPGLLSCRSRRYRRINRSPISARGRSRSSAGSLPGARRSSGTARWGWPRYRSSPPGRGHCQGDRRA